MKQFFITLLLIAILLSGCSTTSLPTEPIATLKSTSLSEPTAASESFTPIPDQEDILYVDPEQPTTVRVDDLLARMSLAEKIGQMTQIEKGSISPGDVTKYFIGSVLSGGGGSPRSNTAVAWAEMVDGYQDAALATPLRIPLIYGVDAVHGHANLKGATVFPQNIGLGAADNPELMFQIGQATAKEMWATGIPWNFGPVVAVPQDIRWGRTYEGYSEDPDLVTRLGVSYLEGLQNPATDAYSRDLFVLATAKHYIGDGGTTWGTSKTSNMGVQYQLDQGDMQVDEAQMRELFLPPYQAAIEAGVQSVMISFSSWDGLKMHAHQYMITEVLKGELGFDGFVVSDWGGIDQISQNYYEAVVAAINAGVDMNMVPYNAQHFISTLTKAVESGDVSMGRIDDAVRRILTVKFNLGLFEQPYSRSELLDSVGSDSHRDLAREAVRESLVLLKNENQALPIAKDAPVIFVAGSHADDIGLQSGGWTIQWQGKAGNITPGTTILEGIQAAISPDSLLFFDQRGQFSESLDENGNPLKADVAIVVIGEQPYAEGVGDRADLNLGPTDVKLINDLRGRSQKLILIIVSGRPLVITEIYPAVDGLIAAWLPGTEGQGVADVIFGDYEFRGKSPYSWPRSNDQLPININNIGNKIGCEAPLFPFGYGLGQSGSEPIDWIDCP